MRRIALAACAAVLVPSAGLAAETDTACDAMVKRIEASMPTADDMSKSAKELGLSKAQLEAATATLDTAKRLEDDDLLGCLTLANAARRLLVRGAVHPEPTPVIALEAWDTDSFTDSAWRAEALIDAEVYSRAGEPVGDVEDILIEQGGDVAAVVVEGGGVLDIGDRHVRVDWDEVRLSDAGEVSVPLARGEMTDFSFYDDNGDGVKVARDETRVTHVLGKEVRYRNGAPYGYVDDLLFSNGKAKATLIRPDVGYGLNRGMYPYATPYYAAEYGYGAGYDFYLLPYERSQIEGLEPFDANTVGGPNAESEPGMGS